MMTRRTEEGALKCAFLDLRREDARAVGITVSRRVPTQTPGTTNSTRSGPWESQQQGNIIPALSLVILAIFEGGCYCRRWIWAAGCLIVVVRRRGVAGESFHQTAGGGCVWSEEQSQQGTTLIGRVTTDTCRLD